MKLNDAHNAALAYIDGAYYEAVKMVGYREEMSPEVSDVVIRHPALINAISELVCTDFTYGVEDHSSRRKRQFYAQKPTGDGSPVDSNEVVKMSSWVSAKHHPNLPRSIKSIVRNLVEYNYCEELQPSDVFDQAIEIDSLAFYTTKRIAESISRLQVMTLALAIKEGLTSDTPVTVDLFPYIFSVSSNKIAVNGKLLFIAK